MSDARWSQARLPADLVWKKAGKVSGEAASPGWQTMTSDKRNAEAAAVSRWLHGQSRMVYYSMHPTSKRRSRGGGGDEAGCRGPG